MPQISWTGQISHEYLLINDVSSQPEWLERYIREQEYRHENDESSLLCRWCYRTPYEQKEFPRCTSRAVAQALIRSGRK